MISGSRKLLSLFLVCIGFVLFTNASVSSNQVRLPNPAIFYIGAEYFETGGKSFIRYRYNVDNFAAYPADMFAPAPTLPPCGANTNAARTWVDIYDQTGKRLNGFCALGTPSDLNKIWFALEQDVVPPSWIYIELTDRQTGTKYKSNLADTVM